MSRTVDRLRDVATAVGAQVTEQDLPELQLAEQVPVRRRWSAGRWLVPLVAAASVVVAVGSATMLGQFLGHREASHRSGAHRGQIPPPLMSTPKYLVTAQAAHAYVKSVATGRTIAKIPLPVKDYRIEGLTAAPGNRVFYLAGEVLDPYGGRLMFFRIKLRSDGHPEPAEKLPGHTVKLPIPITSNALVNIPIAVSPDGSQIAYTWPNDLLGEPASQSTKIIVCNVATGATRTWDVSSGGQTEISQLSWAADGQLSYVAVIGQAAVRHGWVISDRRHSLRVLAILNTLRPAGQLLAASRLITYSTLIAATTQPNSGSAWPPNGVQAGLISADGSTVIAQIVNRNHTAELVEISAVTRKITRVLLSGSRAFQAIPVAVDGDNLLFTLSPKQEHPNGSYLCGHLALAKLSTGRIAGLPFGVYCSTVAPPQPIFFAW
ncbi:MAG TPA: hypothetical protein VFI65_02720 [Streptosporangiaceae bacterium]|nr:hypothetical protein [Streptosporangiaceae bacterium]